MVWSLCRTNDLQGDSQEEQRERVEAADADSLVRQLHDIWEDYDAQGEDHASTVRRGALPLIIKRAPPVFSFGL